LSTLLFSSWILSLEFVERHCNLNRSWLSPALNESSLTRTSVLFFFDNDCDSRLKKRKRQNNTIIHQKQLKLHHGRPGRHRQVRKLHVNVVVKIGIVFFPPQLCFQLPTGTHVSLPIPYHTIPYHSIHTLITLSQASGIRQGVSLWTLFLDDTSGSRACYCLVLCSFLPLHAVSRIGE
jgi:hypothetical protein